MDDRLDTRPAVAPPDGRQAGAAPGVGVGAAPGSAPAARFSRRRVWLARALAAGADALQIFLFPLFGEGFASPADWVLDAAMALALTRLVGFHWSYLPGAALELVPVADLAPTWTAAALLATRGRGGAGKWLLVGAAGLVAVGVAVALWARSR